MKNKTLDLNFFKIYVTLTFFQLHHHSKTFMSLSKIFLTLRLFKNRFLYGLKYFASSIKYPTWLTTAFGSLANYLQITFRYVCCRTILIAAFLILWWGTFAKAFLNGTMITNSNVCMKVNRVLRQYLLVIYRLCENTMTQHPLQQRFLKFLNCSRFPRYSRSSSTQATQLCRSISPQAPLKRSTKSSLSFLMHFIFSIPPDSNAS